MTIKAPPLAETFAGMAGRMRVEDKASEEGRSADRRFAVMVQPFGPEGLSEFELCAVQYRPHALAIAALPELVDLALRAARGLAPKGLARSAIKRAEGRS